MDNSTRQLNVFSKPLVCFDYDELATILADAGADGIDLSVRAGGHVLPENVERDLPLAVEAAHKKGLTIEMIVTAINNADDPMTERILKTASSLGIKYYRMGYFGYNEKLGVMENLQKIKPKLKKLEALNRKYNIHGAYQNHYGGPVGGAVWDLYELLHDLDPQYIGCQYDIRHAVAEGGNAWKIGLKLIAPWVKCTVLKDFLWEKTELGWKPVSVPMGEGMVNFDDYFKLIKEYGISGPISIHLEYPPFERQERALSTQEKKTKFTEAIKKDIQFSKKELLDHALMDHEKPSKYTKSILTINGLVALWDFKEESGTNRKAYGLDTFPLKEQNGEIERIDEGPLSGYSALFKNCGYLQILNNQTGRLNIYGKHQAITVAAWVKWNGNTGFVAGMWNEHENGGKRQYGLFVSLPYYNGAEQVCGHISQTGKPTPPFPYSIDYSASNQKVKCGVWQFIAFTYDGKFIKSYLNGTFQQRKPELINNTGSFDEYPQGLTHSKNPYFFPYGIGNNGSNFTVGAVLLKSGMGNCFNGQIGGLAVFNRALSEDELKKIGSESEYDK
ncbi:MAG: TIM barrel protein [Salinivirgaceae bacterium]|nr:TIM barrel protein [Salinivirgaceae bacterium]